MTREAITYLNPTAAEKDVIERAVVEIEKVARAMGPEVAVEYGFARMLIERELEDWQGNQQPFLFADAIFVRMVFLGLVRKAEIGDDNDTFHHFATHSEGHAHAYAFGQKLVRWNRLMERRWLDRVLGRKGPLNALKLAETCRAAIEAADSWDDRAEAAA